MKKLIFLVTIGALSFASNVFAQTAQVAPAEQPVVTLAPPQMNKLNQGTEVSLRLLRELTTKDKALKVGDRFDLILSS